MTSIIIIFVISVIATTLSSMSGGGASVITIPVMMSIGISFPLAIATQKIASIFWVLPASRNYLRGRKIDWKFLILFSLIGLAGVSLGVSLVVHTKERELGVIIGVFILLLVAYTALKKDIGLDKEVRYSKARQMSAYLFAPFLGFYEALFGSGNGIMFSLVTLKTRNFDFVDALGYYYAVSFPWQILTAGLLISKGYFSLSVMLPAILGAFIGGYLGSRYAKYKGNKFIKMMFIFIGTILGFKLLFGF